jgi:hypothetical protein
VDWLKKHTDTCIIIAFVVGAALWMNNSIKDLQKDVAVIKTVLIVKGIMPTELATNK